MNLESLDLSFNRIAVLENLSGLKKLKNAYFVHNKIDKIQGLEEVNDQFLDDQPNFKWMVFFQNKKLLKAFVLM